MKDMKNEMTGESGMILSAEGKKGYQKPELKKFGSVSTLTMSGSGQNPENKTFCATVERSKTSC